MAVRCWGCQYEFAILGILFSGRIAVLVLRDRGLGGILVCSHIAFISRRDGFVLMEAVSGGTGDGKTKNAVARIFAHLDEGGVAACNFYFKPGWAWRMAVRSYDHKELGKPLDVVARSFWNRLWLCGRPDTIVQFAKLVPGLVEGPVAKRFDRHGLIVLDEGHFYIRPENYRENGPWLGLFNQQRKRKIHVMLITNDASFLDAKVRKLFKVISRCINLSEHRLAPA